MAAPSLQNARLPQSPSQLADSLANIRLNDEPGHGDATEDDGGEDDGGFATSSKHDRSSRVSVVAISEELKRIAAGLDAIRAHFFTIQEKRHAGVFAMVDVPVSTATHDVDLTPSKAKAGDTEKSVALDLEMARLNELMEDVSDRMRRSEDHLNTLDDENQASAAGSMERPALERKSSISSLSSLESFDDALGGIGSIGLLRKPEALRRQHAELSRAWESVQQEAKTLEDDLRGDKYLLVFTSFADQLEEVMNSLDKALANCHDFVFAFNRDRAQQALGRNEVLSTSLSPHRNASVSEDELLWRSKEERLAVLQSVKRSFNVKRRSYGPACEQMFVALEKGVKQHGPSNGTILRRFSDLKARWRNLRERVSRMDKELVRIESQLVDLGGDDGQQSMLRDPRFHSPSSSSPSGSHLRNDLSPRATPPSKPAKSANRMSMLDLRKTQPASSGGHLGEHARSSSLAIPAPRAPMTAGAIRSRTSSLANASPDSVALASSPPISYPRRAVARQEAKTSRTEMGLRGRSPTSDFSPSSHRSTMLFDDSFSSDLGSGEIKLVEDEETLMDLTERVASTSPTRYRSSSAMGLRQGPPSILRPSETAEGRPSSSVGLHDRSPSAAGHRESRIPRLINSMRRGSSTFGDSDRPSSALSFVSTSTTTASKSRMFGQSPRSNRERSAGTGPTSAEEEQRQRRHQNSAALRSSMQTPEPTIMARVQRMSLFGGGVGASGSSKRSSRPPPTTSRHANSLYNATQNASSSSLGSAAPTAQSPQVKPLNVSKRQSGIWGALTPGRATPLSAAALAKVPHGRVDINVGPEGNGEASTGVARAKARNFTTDGQDQRNRANRTSYAPSATSGRVTPTYSDGGNSSVWGGGSTYYRRGMQSVQGGDHAGSTYKGVKYRPNPNDAIDVEVARVVNNLGVRIERVDPPLARGVKELNPSSGTLVRYQIGEKIIVCKLLQLHRPGSYGGDGDSKAKKILTRVGGGWIDLEQYLLSRLGTM